MTQDTDHWLLVLVSTMPDGYRRADADRRVNGSREQAKTVAQRWADDQIHAQHDGWRYHVDAYDYVQWRESNNPRPLFTVKPSKARAAAADKAYRAEEARRSHDWDTYFKLTKAHKKNPRRVAPDAVYADQDPISKNWLVRVVEGQRHVAVTDDWYASKAAAEREAQRVRGLVRGGMTASQVGSELHRGAHKKNPRRVAVGARVQDEYGNLGVVEEAPKHRGAHYWVQFPERKKNPFTGNGWTEEKAWILAAKATPPTPFGAARADAIIAAARKGASGPWSDRLTRVMSKGEYAYVDRLWATMPGSYSFVNTLNHIAQGAKP
jgi:hypothetical protein